ncbi:hypothetical protein F4604DRAFT_1930681 [Suillus subluteus]|nr:hypothetical protein F4604DRAFT_1930681 [Suillus subluteus]
MALRDLNVLMEAPKPQPWVCPVTKKKPTIEDNSNIAEDALAEDTIEGEDVEMADADEDNDEDFQLSTEENAKVLQQRKKCVQKTAYHNTVQKNQNVTETIAAHGDPKGKKGVGTNHQYQNDNLPVGCQDDNTWCHVFIPTVAHWADGEVKPWGPSDEELREIMQDIWDTIYWTGEDFSKAMLKYNQSIFKNNVGLIPKDWTGMWRSSFILQMFTSHLNFTFSHVEIPTLDTRNLSARAAFTLAVTALFITFEIIQETCGKQKGAKMDDSDVWTPIIAKALSNDDFASIVKEAQQCAKHAKSARSSRATTSVMPDEDDIFEDLFAFC